ncbi:MAG: hypothetical protein U0V56_12300 [Actinomycetota bacterium]
MTEDAKVPDHWPLAFDSARFIGDGLAVVVGETLAAAQDGAEAVVLDLEMRPSVTDVGSAMEPGAPLVHEEEPGRTGASASP